MPYSIVIPDILARQLQALQHEQSFVFKVDQEAFVSVCIRQTLYIYKNRCPHQNKQLCHENAWDDSKTLLECEHHGAQFTPTNGVCVVGPCVGEKLLRFRLRHHNMQAYLEEYT